MKWIKFLIISLVVYISACQTNVERAGGNYAHKASMWTELADISQAQLIDLGYTVTASIQRLDNNEYKLVNIRFVRLDDFVDIDLLSPEFAKRFACNSECMRLNEYDEQETIDGSVLADFFAQKEGEFFRFYGSLINLNKRIKGYQEVSMFELIRYLDKLTSHGRQFDSLSELSKYLAYQFDEDVWLRFIAREESLDKKLETLNNTEKLFQGPELAHEHNPDKELLASWSRSINEEQELFDKAKESLLLGPKSGVVQLDFEYAKRVDLYVGATVCSYESNTVAKLISYDDLAAEVQLIAYAHFLIDGIKVRPTSGYIFSEKDDYLLTKIKGRASYKRNDIAVCNFR